VLVRLHQMISEESLSIFLRSVRIAGLRGYLESGDAATCIEHSCLPTHVTINTQSCGVQLRSLVSGNGSDD
jgi:hypothetical protein